MSSSVLANCEPASRVPGVGSSLDWRELPIPALCEDAQGRIVDANEAFCRLLGRSLSALLGREPSDFQPPEDRAFQIHAQSYAREAALRGETPAEQQRCFVSATGVMHWCRLWLKPWCGEAGPEQWLWLLQDISEEHRARAQADRSLDELTQWFNLSPSGKVVYDEGGLILRSNPVFDAWVDAEPVILADASLALQQLLGWRDGALRSDLRPGMPVLETQAEFDRPSGQVLRLTARLRAHLAEDGSCRVMAVVEDRSAEAERDLAQLEMGALMSAAGLGVATFDAEGRSAKMGAGVADLQDSVTVPAGLSAFDGAMVEDTSRAAYDRLQQALQTGQSAEARYAVRHPELGPRWLLTRVEPTRLRSGREATSVVTLDITDQELARQHGEELLRELTTILDGSPVGIAYLREGRLVRCNLRFERMLGFEPGASADKPLQRLFEFSAQDGPGLQEALRALALGTPCDVELAINAAWLAGHEAGGQASAGAADPPADTWYALSIRRAAQADSGQAAVAVLTDISGLKRQQAEIERALHERELMFNQSDVGIAWLRDRRILRANAAMSDLTGLTAPELTGLELLGLFSVDDALKLEQELRPWLSARGRYIGEHRLRHRDGGLGWVQVAVRAVDAADSQSDLIFSFVDVDERHRARESLQQLAGRTRAVLDSVLVGIVTVGDQGIEWMNRSARRMFAGELEDFAGEPIDTVATPEPDHPLSRTGWLLRLADGESENFECRLKARDGREFWVVGNAVATPRDLAVGRQVTFALLDIEARRQAEVRISGARASLQRLIETAPLAIALFDARSLQAVECNQAAEAFFGVPASRLLGSLPEDCFDDGDQAAALRASLVLARDTPEGVRREITRPAYKAQGSQRWDTRFVYLGAPGTASGSGRTEPGQVLLVANDVTELRVAEQARLDAAIAQREMLVKEVHHRIKNNLQGVAGLLQQNAQRRPELRVELMEAIGQVQAIAHVYGLQVGAAGPMDLLGVLSAIAGSVQRALNHVIEVGLDEPAAVRWQLPEAESIPLALTLNELLNNAIKHGDRSPVRCRVVSREEDVLIEISNGGTLPPDFDLRRTPAGMHGLGLVRALLPRRAATLELFATDGRVTAAMTLKPPSVRRPLTA